MKMQTTNVGIQLFKKSVSAAKDFSPVLICAAKETLIDGLADSDLLQCITGKSTKRKWYAVLH